MQNLFSNALLNDETDFNCVPGLDNLELNYNSQILNTNTVVPGDTQDKAAQPSIDPLTDFALDFDVSFSLNSLESTELLNNKNESTDLVENEATKANNNDDSVFKKPLLTTANSNYLQPFFNSLSHNSNENKTLSKSSKAPKKNKFLNGTESIELFSQIRKLNSTNQSIEQKELQDFNKLHKHQTSSKVSFLSN